MSKKQKPLNDEVSAILAGRLNWWDRLPDEAKTELLSFRKSFHAGEYGTVKAYSIASAVIKASAARGWKLCCEKQLANWLCKRG